LAIAKSDGVTSVVPGTTDTYTITVTNSGPSTVNSVTLSDTIPTALLHPVFGTPSSGSFNTTNGLWTVTLASGSSATMTLAGTIDPAATGSITNTVTVTAPSGVSDTNTANNTATDTDTIAPLSPLADRLFINEIKLGANNTSKIELLNDFNNALSSSDLSKAALEIVNGTKITILKFTELTGLTTDTQGNVLSGSALPGNSLLVLSEPNPTTHIGTWQVFSGNTVKSGTYTDSQEWDLGSDVTKPLAVNLVLNVDGTATTTASITSIDTFIANNVPLSGLTADPRYPLVTSLGIAIGQ